MKTLPIFLIFLLIMSSVSFAGTVKAESSDFEFNNVVYIISGRTFIEDNKDVVLDSNFFVWHSFSKVHITYSKDGYDYINDDYRTSVVPIQLVDGAHLTVSANGTTYYDTVTHINTVENVARYQMGIIYDGVVLTAIISIFLACGFVLNKWRNLRRDIIGYEKKFSID